MAEKLQDLSLSQHDKMFLSELGETAEHLLNAHDARPRIYVPDEIDDLILDDIQSGAYEPQAETIPAPVLDALTVNLLTEDGLPYYTSTLMERIPEGHPFLEWVHQWTGEEARHSPLLRAFLHRTKQVNMRELEALRMAMMRKPDTPKPGSLIESIIYPAIQEPATETAHNNASAKLPESHRKYGRLTIGKVVGDEVKHGIFYGELSVAALKVNPSITVQAIAKQIAGFAMPGKGIPGFKERAQAIEEADIFGGKQLLAIYQTLLKERWPLEHLARLSPEAEQARDFIYKKIGQLARAIERREERKAKAFSLGPSTS